MTQGAEEFLCHDLRESDHRVQGRAQFVTHGGQELALGPVGDLRAFLRLVELLFGFLAVGHVTQRTGHAIDLAGFVAQHDAAIQDPAIAAVIAA